MNKIEHTLQTGSNRFRVLLEHQDSNPESLIVIVHSGSLNQYDSTVSKETLLYDQMRLNAQQNATGVVRFDTVSDSIEKIGKEEAFNENLSRTIEVLKWIETKFPDTPIILHGMSAGARTILTLPKDILLKNVKSILLLSCFIVAKVDLAGVPNVNLIYGEKDCVRIRDKESKDETKILFPRNYASFCFHNLQMENEHKFIYLVDNADHFLCIGDEDYTKTIETINSILNLQSQYENIS